MGKWISALMACVFLAFASAPSGYAQDAAKATPKAQSVQKKAAKKAPAKKAPRKAAKKGSSRSTSGKAN